MNIKNEIGSVFYRVEYKGFLSRLTIVRYKNEIPVYSIESLTSLKNEEYKIIENPTVFGTSSYSLDLPLSKPYEYFDNIDDAKKKSLERFEKEVNPNGNYKVARYFDSVFEAYVTGILTKKEAREKAIELNKKTRYYVHYDICSVKKENK